MKAVLRTAALLTLGALFLAAPRAGAGRPAAATGPRLGPNASLGGKQVFPPDNPWNRDVSREPVDPNSHNLLASIGLDTPIHPDFGNFFGKQYVVVSGSQPRVPVLFEFPRQSDPGPYPIPPDCPIETDDDRHVSVIDRDAWKLYELYDAVKVENGWQAYAGAVFDLGSNRMRPAGWTSADAAGLPIFPALVRYDEVFEQREIRHALRFTVVRTRQAYVYPARHFASKLTDPNLPPMGMRVRLKASYDISGFPPAARVVLKALKSYGMFVADHGQNWLISGAPDRRWNNRELRTLRRVHGRDFEVVRMPKIETKR